MRRGVLYRRQKDDKTELSIVLDKSKRTKSASERWLGSGKGLFDTDRRVTLPSVRIAGTAHPPIAPGIP